ncbi:MAG: hypothetical protein K6U74_03220 [Firmicutes bacterium]|nr:hypothetical protein [Bacillota bacterium]
MCYPHPDPALASAVSDLLRATCKEKDLGKRIRAIGQKAREMPGDRELNLRAAFHACLYLRKGGKKK